MTGAEYAQKWGTNLKSSSDSIVRGVEAVTKAPTLSAAEKQDKMLANLKKSVESGKWAAGLKRVTLAEWQSAMKERGIPRISGGVDGAQDRMALFGEELMAYQSTLSATIAKMPDVTLEDSINRAVAQIRGMSNFKRKS